MAKELVEDIAKQFGIKGEHDLQKWYRISPAGLGVTAQAVRWCFAQNFLSPSSHLIPFDRE